MKRATKVTAVMVGLAFAITAMSQGCRTATQVELVVTYNGACTDLDEVAFIIGTDAKIAEGRIETNLFTTTTKQCTPGAPNRVGTLVVTPNDATGHASIIVLASSFGQPITACKPEMGYQGCIVARRAFAFVDHTALTLEIPLEVDCKNVPCDAESTCKHAACVASTVSCDERGCSEPGALPDGGTELVDAPTDPDGFVQRLDAESMADVGADAPGITDASLEADAPPTMDAGIDSGANGGTCGVPFQHVSCNTPAGVKTCTDVNPVCCYSAVGMTDGGGAASYDCRNGCGDDPSHPAIVCKNSTNCQAGQVCCINYYGGTYCAASCTMDAGLSAQACASSCDCPGNKACGSGPLVGSGPPQQLGECLK